MPTLERPWACGETSCRRRTVGERGIATFPARTTLSTACRSQTPTPGQTWTVQARGRSDPLYAVSFVNAVTGIAVGSAGTILRTQDGGGPWTAQASGTSNDLYGVSFVDANTGTAVGYAGTILYTTDGGEAWTLQTS